MTEIQAFQIREMRLKGVGYRTIASTIGLSRDSVRNYCKSNGINGFADAAKLNLKEQINQGNACMLCGKVLEQPGRGRQKKFCSDSCRRQWWKNHSDLTEKKESAIYKSTCAKCGRDFEIYGNKKRKYCSHNCYIKDRFYKEEQDGI